MGVDAYFANWRGFFAAPNLSKKRAQAFRDVLGEMYKTKEWEVVRKRNGCVNLYQPGKTFRTFLEKQEKVVGSLMKEMGFL